MKILYIVDKIDTGGVETILTLLSVSLKTFHSDCVIEILTPHKNVSANSILLEQEGVHIIHTYYRQRLNPFNFYSYYSVIKKGNYDIIHVHHLRQQLWGAIMSYFLSNIYITTEHGVYNKKRSFGILRHLDRIIYSRYKCVISVSQSTQDSLLCWLKMTNNGKFFMIYNGIDIKSFSQKTLLNRNVLGFSDADKIIITVNRMVYGKDIATILRALQLLPEHYKFLAVGDGPDLEAHIKLSVNLGIESRVVFIGKRTDISSLLHCADVYVASTLFEGFSTSIIEAMAASLPVLGTNIPPVSEVLIKEEYLFEIGDYQGLAFKIVNLTDDIQNSIVKKFVCEHVQNFSINTMSQNHYILYQSIL